MNLFSKELGKKHGGRRNISQALSQKEQFFFKYFVVKYEISLNLYDSLKMFVRSIPTE